MVEPGFDSSAPTQKGVTMTKEELVKAFAEMGFQFAFYCETGPNVGKYRVFLRKPYLDEQTFRDIQAEITRLGYNAEQGKHSQAGR